MREYVRITCSIHVKKRSDNNKQVVEVKTDGSVVFAMRAHWPHLANTIEFVLPLAHPSPQLKRQIDRFSRFRTAHGRKSVYFTMSAPFSQNCAFSWGIWTDHHLTHGSLGSPESSTQIASRSVQPFLQAH